MKVESIPQTSRVCKTLDITEGMRISPSSEEFSFQVQDATAGIDRERERNKERKEESFICSLIQSLSIVKKESKGGKGAIFEWN